MNSITLLFKSMSYFFVCLLPFILLGQELDLIVIDLIHKGFKKNHIVSINEINNDGVRLNQKLAKSVLSPNLIINGSFTRLDTDTTFDNDIQNMLIRTPQLLIK